MLVSSSLGSSLFIIFLLKSLTLFFENRPHFIGKVLSSYIIHDHVQETDNTFKYCRTLTHSFLKDKGLDKKKDVLSKIMVSMKGGSSLY